MEPIDYRVFWVLGPLGVGAPVHFFGIFQGFGSSLLYFDLSVMTDPEMRQLQPPYIEGSEVQETVQDCLSHETVARAKGQGALWTLAQL